MEKEEINPKKVILRRIWEKICVQSKSTVSGDVPGSSVSGLGADLGVPGTGEVSRDGAGAAYKSSSLSKRGILPCICIRKVLGDEFAASEGTAAKEEQEYIQCWHGTPLKRLGYDLDHYAEKNGSLLEVQGKLSGRDEKRVTHMPSPSEFYSEKIASAFHLKEEGKEQVLLEMGYPRNDDLVKFSDMDCEKARQELRIPKGKKVILYAPTWRENQHLPGEGYQFQLPVDFKRWREVLGEEYVVLFRAHYFISNSFEFEAFQGFVYDVSQMDDINPLYLAADVLITDYSSVFFDYANLRRPILFFMYDYEQYKHEMRDFYFDIHMLPGPC